MRRPFPRLAAACAFAVAMTAFTGSAFAGNGNGQGNDSAPGQVKKDQAAATPGTCTGDPAAATDRAAAAANGGRSHSHSTRPGEPAAVRRGGQAKSQSAAAASQSSTQLGVKPASHTTKWTHCTTGGAVGSTTCASSDNGHTPQPNPDASKLYGNGQTAAQIAVSRGGIGVQLTGPGNSQPHKVTVCGKPNNKSGGVDVHAIKSYPATGCAPDGDACFRGRAGGSVRIRRRRDDLRDGQVAWTRQGPLAQQARDVDELVLVAAGLDAELQLSGRRSGDCSRGAVAPVPPAVSPVVSSGVACDAAARLQRRARL